VAQVKEEAKWHKTPQGNRFVRWNGLPLYMAFKSVSATGKCDGHKQLRGARTCEGTRHYMAILPVRHAGSFRCSTAGHASHDLPCRCPCRPLLVASTREPGACSGRTMGRNTCIDENFMNANLA
jgi:hypothetical protein